MPSRRFIFVCLILTSLLIVRFYLFYRQLPVLHNGEQINLQVTLEEEPMVSSRGQEFSIKTDQNQQIYLKTSLSPHYHYGDSLAIAGQLQVKKSQKGRTIYSMNFPKIHIAKETENLFSEATDHIRNMSTALYEETLPPVSASLLLGIVFGAKEQFPPDFLQHLRTVGVLHVIAASGMNVSFFTGALMFSLGTFLKRRFAIILSIFGVIFYSLLVGFQASILRASIMAIIAFTASFFGRQNIAVTALFGTGYLMLLWQPSFLFDVGFQLSFLATLGILIIKPLLPLGKNIILSDDVGTTIAAELATLPVMLSTFGQYGLLSIVVNALVLWTVPILMFLGSLAVLFGFVFTPAGKLFLFFCLPFLLFFEKVVDFFGSLDWIMQIDSFGWSMVVGYYFFLGAMLITLKKRQSNKSIPEKKL